MTSSLTENEYLGSGVLIVDIKSSCLLLVYDYTKDYNCCGGQIKYSDNDLQRLEKTACEELYEETRTLISCDINYLINLPFVDISTYKSKPKYKFRCYILKLECSSDICEQFIQFNMDKLSINQDFYEVTSMDFFPIEQFLENETMLEICQTLKAKDNLGNEKLLNQRVISVIKAAIEQNLL